ncbi:MAG: SDR family NAD(P)-dependent oxidoreductase [Alphaproteobacteria bacterium]|nr:SDR family NAD(P)-dependent oxidoreductase [Alphaproteobacteria bacterium]MDP6238091.1 SDR family NAD(P)-dependent oxidoreductase [Alphaproteobacteria bacterium]MDP7172174.1 SDR family NAD(P)-dependent oxidoreductase [Alphaproteobacteria bacterium]MDP7234008.1 SDR family NAD(P)-dependent oxidoreductase [Alphaproteobacteria bacterium]MDP7488092.1 SDR family NAD(P)-dependent oxidoreductase [Alphaproteobacteria bacterium]
MTDRPCTLIVGAGSGLSASLAHRFASDGHEIVLAARNTDKLSALCDETGASAQTCDATKSDQVAVLFDAIRDRHDRLDLVVYNPSWRPRGPLVDLVSDEVETALAVTCFGAFLVAQAATRVMLPRGTGSIFFTGASAGVKGYARSAPFAMGKFGLRGLAQSMARELSPQGLHIAHFVIDGGIRGVGTSSDSGDRMLDPDAIAETYHAVHKQHRSAWSWEVELRPWGESF